MQSEITDYIGCLFSAALKKSGNLTDAEDLTQEVLLAALSYQERGGAIANMPAWLFSTLHRKWNDMLRKKYRLPTVSIDMIAEEPVEAYLPDYPTVEQVRREVAYLAKLQRDVIVKHYLQGKHVQVIADELRIPKGTVLSRLSSGREQIRKGLDAMEQYEKQSYIPEHLDISCHGMQGLHDEPWSLVAGDLMKQNILIIAYEKPVTATEIARGLGIPTPYIENAVEDLVKSQLMCRSGNKVFTDFLINTPDQLERCLDKQMEIAECNYTAIWACLQKTIDEVEALPWYGEMGERQKVILTYYAILDCFSRGIYTATKRIVDVTEEYPARPDGGAWIAQGIRYPADFDFAGYRVAKYCYGGERRAYWENFLSAKSIDLHVYDTQPDLNKYEHGPVAIHDDTLCKLLYILHQGIPFDAIGFNLMYAEDIPHLAECGVLQYDTGKPTVAVPILSKVQFDTLWQILLKNMCLLADVLEAPLRDAFPSLKIDIPRHLEGRIAEFRQYSCYALPMAVMKKAIHNGDFLQGIEFPTPPMVLIIET